MRFSGVKKRFALQLACFAGLIPFTLYWFSYGAVNGIVANIIAIPLVGYFIVPLSLLSLLCCVFFKISFLFFPVHYLIKGLLVYLEWVDKISMVNLEIYVHNILELFALMLGMIVLFFLPDQRLRLAAVLLIISSLFPSYPRIKKNNFQLDVVDVGQGLSVVVRTENHVLVYDTGMKFYQGSDMAQLAIIPYLRSIGIKAIDTVVISHPDLDHRGGLSSLEQGFPVHELLVDNVEFYHRGSNCHRYKDWSWDGVSFHFFPILKTFPDKNNSSCVLLISNKHGRVLLTGDIEKLAENYLVKQYNRQLAADLIVIAHHGSKTSSTKPFIRAVSPRFAVISAGFDNRYRFPHVKTLDTLNSQHIRIYNTIDCGMVGWKVDEPKALPDCFRTS